MVHESAPWQSLDFNCVRTYGRSSSQPENSSKAKCKPHTVDDHSDDEDSCLDIAAAVSFLGQVNKASEENYLLQQQKVANRQKADSGGALSLLDIQHPVRGSASSASTPGKAAKSDSRGSLEMQPEPKGAVSWNDIEQFCQKLDSECTEVRIESFDLSCMEEDESALKDLQEFDAGIDDSAESTTPLPAGDPTAKPPTNPSRKKKPETIDLAYATAAASAASSEVSYSFASASPTASAKSPSPSPSSSTSGRRGGPLALSPGHSGTLSMSSACGRFSTGGSGQLAPLGTRQSPNASGQFPLAGKASPTGSMQSASKSGSQASYATSQASISSASQFNMPSMGPGIPMGGDIIGVPMKPMPTFSNAIPTFHSAAAQAAPVRQVSGAWQQDRVEIQPVLVNMPPVFQMFPANQVTVDLPHNGEKAARKMLDMELFEANSRPTRSSSMVVPGAMAVRPATRPVSNGFIGGFKARCGELFSSSKKSKGR